MQDEHTYFLPHSELQTLILALQNAGFTCMGPQVRDGAIIYDHLSHAEQLPWGIRDIQSPGDYKLEKINEAKAFAFANGPEALKHILFKPREVVWRIVRNEQGKIEFKPVVPDEKPIAFIGARSCDLAAMAIQDKVFIQGAHVDTHYKNRREKLFVIAVQCTYSSANCFCVSAGTGPHVINPFDILMTEIENGFIVNAGSERGAVIINSLKLIEAEVNQKESALSGVNNAANMQTKRIPLDNQRGLRDLLFANLDHPRWDEVAEKCLSCGNCTSACPTCFCHTEVEEPKLNGNESEHIREWDSCFTAGHSYIAGKVIRDDTSKRYRQWLTHKVGSWFDQFDTSGCVGCGRCITWCPVGIDITEELAAISGESNQRGEKK